MQQGATRISTEQKQQDSERNHGQNDQRENKKRIDHSVASNCQQRLTASIPMPGSPA